MKRIFGLLVLVLGFTSAAFARPWQRIEVPGALCGDGEPYSVFVDIKNTDKLVVEFMAGGACWNEISCYGRAPLASLQPLRGNPSENLLTSEKPDSQWSTHSYIYFPYCTADVFSGQHVASYKSGVTLYHYGYQNVVLSLQYLQQNKIIAFSNVQKVVVWGASAGAIGAFVHAANIEALISPSAQKTLISDSPGLHFGVNFWKKFSDSMNHDFQLNMGAAGFHYSLDNGFLAPLMGPVFSKYAGWKIGILQSTKDIVMSLVFGNIKPEDHRRLVLGPQGIGQVATGYSNVQAWINDSSMHTFLLREVSGDMRSMQGETAREFAYRIYAR